VPVHEYCERLLVAGAGELREELAVGIYTWANRVDEATDFSKNGV
jgi:hypothetical protein